MRKKNMQFQGSVLVLYIISSIVTFILGIYGASKMNVEGEKLNFNIFTYTLPFISFVMDHSTKKLMNLREKSVFIVIKLLAIVYYLGAYVLGLQQESSTKYY